MKKNVQNRGMKVSMNKTKAMISGERQKPVQKAARWPCGVCCRGVEELTVTDSVPDFCGSPLGAMEISVFWPKNRGRSTFGAAPWQYHRRDPRA